MKFVSAEEARAWCPGVAKSGVKDGFPDCEPQGMYSARISFESAPEHQHYWIAQQLVRATNPPWDTCLFWVGLTGVWSSNENLHLYYRLRASYGDQSHLEDRPALFALKHEVADVESFVRLAILFGWDGYLVTAEDYGRVHVNHDGFAIISGEDEPSIRDVAGGFAAAGLRVEHHRPAV